MRTSTLICASLTAGLGFLTGCPADETHAGNTDPTTDPSGEDGTTTSGGSADDGVTSGFDTGAMDETAGMDDGGPATSGSSFIVPTDNGGIVFECDLWAQDCPEGQKCMPWANDGGNSWNATKCSPLDPQPAQPGDTCTVEGSGVSGVDDCDIASMCWDVDPETNTGTCVAFCQGSDENPSCDDPSTACSITNDGALILCLPTCDPLLQDCAEGNACYPLLDEFVCAPDASGEMGLYGDPCEYLNACDPGLFCASADVVPGCVGSAGCCSEYCDVTDPNVTCSGADGGQACSPYYEEGMTPPGSDDIGVCIIPS